jgi:hypothetical protein
MTTLSLEFPLGGLEAGSRFSEGLDVIAFSALSWLLTLAVLFKALGLTFPFWEPVSETLETALEDL